ncbi:loganic acid O-methyltransferase-like [Aristolochia californica]|uniref:loganic acid O-methyltransferase-like n=1 Tax=Aristolochia californica TaxID=171875 RepID=UPI0035D7F2A6
MESYGISIESLPTNFDNVKAFESYPMNGGDGPASYAHNSHYQGEGVNAAKKLISEAIDQHSCLKQLSSLKTYHVADLGCSVGPNTFTVVQNIIDSVKHKLPSLGRSSNVMDFHVSFNDHKSNDFNTLFISLPSKSQRYFAAGVPGSFHGRLFPRSFLHFVHCSYAIHWLSQVPYVLTDETSPAWNKGRIMSDGTKREVEEAYAGQFATDMAIFLQARAEEVAVGGLMALTVPYSKGSVSVQQALFTRLFRILDLTLNDMAAKGQLDEAKVNSFNLPLYIPSAQEIQKLVERNGSFSIEKMQPLTSSTKGFNSRLDARQCSLMVRAPMEGIMSQYFGSESINEIFEVYVEIAEENSEFISQSAALTEDLFVLLKRKA